MLISIVNLKTGFPGGSDGKVSAYNVGDQGSKIIEPLARLTKIKKREDTITGKMDLELQILQPTKG